VVEVLNKHLASLDEDILSYITAVIEDMELDERKSSASLNEAIGPFLVDCGFSDSEEAAESYCKTIAIAFGGSGFKQAVAAEPDHIALLSAPIKIKDQSGLKAVKNTYGGAVIGTVGADGQVEMGVNVAMEMSAVPTTQKQIRKMRKENERTARILRAEEMERMMVESEMAAARMAAIKANRAAGRQAATGVNIERFSIPHPSGSAELLTDASLTLAMGRRYGMIGKNGAGKSTLMRQLAGYKMDGLIHLRILLVDQHVEGDDNSALQWVLRADVERTALLEDEQKLLAVQHGNADAATLEELQGVNVELALIECYERMEAIGVNSAETRARKILDGLGFSAYMMEHPTGGLSGGWAMRAALAAALFVTPDLLLLDEPTNHLDLHALVWLERWLTERFFGMLLVVSHDEVFLDSVCTDILELRSTLAGQSKSMLTHYNGDYLTYVNTINEKKVNQARLRVAFEKERDKLREFISRDGKKCDNPAHQSQRKMKMKQLQALTEVEGVEDESELVMRFPSPYGSFDPNDNLIAVNGAAFGYGEAVGGQGGLLFSGVDFCVGCRARIAILGKNGCGKTSLLNLLVGENEPTFGEVKRHLGCRVARLQQHHYKGEQLDPNLNPLEHMRRLPQEESSSVGLHDPETRQEETAQRSFLSNFGITGTRAVLPVRYLSGGQRMRVALATALYRRPDLLILDEPTNHLDADTVRALCEALSTFDGAIIAVSHDESFVNKVIKGAVVGDKESKENGTAQRGELWIMSKKRLQRFDGEFNDYKKQIAKKIRSES